MSTEEVNVLSQFEYLTASCEHLTNAGELIIYGKKLYGEIIEIRKRLAEIDNERYFDSNRNRK